MIRIDKESTRRFTEQIRDLHLYARARQAFARQRLSLILIVIGLGLLMYVGHEYWAMHREQQALHQRWQAQQQAAAVAPTVPAVAKDDGLTRVSIPKINLDLIVVEGTNHRALRLGPGHLKNTPLPGEAGNSVLSAHRDTFFRHIYELTKGDEIDIRRDGHTYTFQVIGKKIVEPNDLSVVKNTTDTRLTLITCYPTYYIGPAPERLIVTARLVNDKAPVPQQAETAASTVRVKGS